MERNPYLQFDLPLDVVNLVLRALGKMPFDEVADALQLVRTQAAEQIQKLQTSQPAQQQVQQPAPAGPRPVPHNAAD